MYMQNKNIHCLTVIITTLKWINFLALSKMPKMVLLK